MRGWPGVRLDDGAALWSAAGLVLLIVVAAACWVIWQLVRLALWLAQ